MKGGVALQGRQERSQVEKGGFGGEEDVKFTEQSDRVNARCRIRERLVQPSPSSPIRGS